MVDFGIRILRSLWYGDIGAGRLFEKARLKLDLQEDAMLFHTFGSQRERREFGGSDFIELQYCRLPFGTEMEKILSVDAIEHWAEDSLYIYGDDMDAFYSSYGAIMEGGIHADMRRGPMDCFGINFYFWRQAVQIMERMEKVRPPEYQTVSGWLREGRRFLGFYILGI